MASELNEKIPSPSSTFIGLQSYSEAHADSFFGRDTETDDLTRLVKLNTLTIVFGKSGTGKTSLLNAGVFPKLRKNYCLPFRIRLEFPNKSSDNIPDLISQIKNVLKQEIDKYGFKVNAYPTSETLWEYFHKEPLWKTVTPILVFDQFEEMFTLAKKNPQLGNEGRERFWEELSDLAENSIPKKLTDTFLNSKENIGYNYKNQKVKIVFAFREEFLPEFESITKKIPSIKTSRFRLMPMNGHQAYEVITKTWKENIQPAEAKKIVTYLTKEKDLSNYNLITIEPSLLSQVCAFIDKERIDAGLQKVSTDLLIKYPKDTILRSIYEETIAASSITLLTDPEKKSSYSVLKEFLEEKLITSEGYRTKYSLTSSDESYRPGVESLKEKYFIRQELNAVELTHDVLAPIIKIDREKRRKETAVTAGKKRALKRFIAVAVSVILFSLVLLGLSLFKRAEAEKDLETFITALTEKKDSLELEVLKKHRLSSNSKIESDLKKAAESANISYDSILTDRIKNLQNDSLQLTFAIAQLGKKLMDSEKEKQVFQNELADAKNSIDQLQKENDRLKDDLSRINNKVEDLTKSLLNSKEQVRILRDSINYLNQTIKKQGETINELINKKINPPQQGNLRISVFDSSSKKILFNESLDVYIIPLNKQNNNVLNEEENNIIIQTKECSDEFEELLKKISGYQKAFFSKGYYYFPQIIKNGEYKIKICDIFAGYYDLKMPVNDKKILWKRKNAPSIEIQPGKF